MTRTGRSDPDERSAWRRAAPWVMTATSIAVLTAIALFLWLNMEWFKSEAVKSMDKADERYVLHIYHLQNSLMKRCLGFFTGFSLTFVGCAVALYTVQETTKLDLSAAGSKAVLATASPGLVAMVLGVLLMITTLVNKDHFPEYTGPGGAELPPIQIPK